MRLYALIAAYAFRRYGTYRVAALSATFTNTIFGFLRASVLIALWHARPGLGGYDVTDAVTFSFLTQALLEPVRVFGGSLDLTERIRSGDIAIDLHRPADLQGWWLADDLGRAGFAVLSRGLPPMLGGTLFFSLHWPSAAAWPAFAGAVLLGVLVSFALRYLISLAVFWLHDDRGVNGISLIVSMFFSGMIVPLTIFPSTLGTVSRALPWAALVQLPADVYLGKRTDVLGVYAFQAAWAAVLLAAGRLLTARAHRNLVVNGG
ncbi:ABC-2 family transporter protein [Actinomadura sp. DC4]|uniref:ABC transporter permease n=1 Tax=Actinomadura sp. DC4 TaxID=3055069 RepID=UPI0025B10F51|nr:ABC-2 family transporter protein [Actinomadura sp. DC4]MDN3358098.1 ABC-2 family transporter protein [Actinomadura sp. DC4]